MRKGAALLSLCVIIPLPLCARRWEALPLQLGRLRVEVCTLGWTHASLPQAHRPQALPVPPVREGILQVWPPRTSHEETHVKGAPSKELWIPGFLVCRGRFSLWLNWCIFYLKLFSTRPKLFLYITFEYFKVLFSKDVAGTTLVL